MSDPWEDYAGTAVAAEAAPWEDYGGTPEQPADLSQIKLDPYQAADEQSMAAGRGKATTGMESGTEFLEATKGAPLVTVPLAMARAGLSALMNKVVEPITATIFKDVLVNPPEEGESIIPEELTPYADPDQKGVLPAATRTLRGLTTPGNLLTLPLAVTAKPVQAAFALGAASGIPESAEALITAETPEEQRDAATRLVIDTGFTALAGHGAVGGKSSGRRAGEALSREIKRTAFPEVEAAAIRGGKPVEVRAERGPWEDFRVPTETQPVAPVPEPVETLTAQMEAMVQGRKPAMLITPGAADLPVPEGFKALDTKAGKFIYDPANVTADQITTAVKNDRVGEILGYGSATKPTGGNTVVQTKNAAGVPIQEELAVPETLPAAMSAGKRVAPDGTQEIKNAEQVIAERSLQTATASTGRPFSAADQEIGAAPFEAEGMPPVPQGVPAGAHPGPMPVAMERIMEGTTDVPKVMTALEDVVRVVGGESPIRTGRFYANALGIFKNFSEVIRLRQSDDIPTAAHEVAHAVSNQVFGSTKSRPLMANVRSRPAIKELTALGKALYGSRRPNAGYTAEGFSELVRLWITTEDSPKRAPIATEWFEKTFLPTQPELHASLIKARDLVDIWRGQGAQGRARAMMKGPEPRLQRLKKFASENLGREAQVEEFAPLEQLSRGFEKVTGQRLRPSEDPYMLATAKRRTAGTVLETMVERGMVDVWGNLTGPGLKEAFARLKPALAGDFATYLWARRAIERWSKDQNPGMALADAKYLKQRLESPEFIDAAQKYYGWWDGVLDYLKQASPQMNGAIVDAIRAGSRDYVPLARVLPDSAKSAAQARLGGGLFKMHGSGLPVRDIYLQSLLVAEKLINRAHKDMVLDSVFNLSQTPGMGWLVEQVPQTRIMEHVNVEKIRAELESYGVDTSAIPPDAMVKYATHLDRPTGSDPIMVRQTANGPEWYQVPSKVFDVLEGIDPPRLGKVADIFLGMPSRAFKLGTTGLRASFSLVTNPLRDLPTFFLQSIAGNPAKRAGAYFQSLFDVVRAGLTGKESPEWQTFKQLGVGTSNFVGGDIRHAQREAKGLFRGKVFRRVASPIETLREAFSFSEAAPRLAEMRLMGQEFGWSPGQPLTPDAAVAMSVAAKRVTTDFGAGGRIGNVINQAIPFYNATIQGTRAFLRAFHGDHGVKVKNYAAARAALTGLTLLTLPAISNWWRNKDKDWYRYLPWRERYLYTNVEADDGTIVQVPRPPEWGNAFMVVPEMLLDTWYLQDPEAAKQGLSFILDSQNPVDFPVLLKLAKEQWQNRIDFFDRPIVPRGEIDLPPGEQRAYFSSKIATALGDAFPNQVSPRRVDAAIRSLFGGVGGDLATAPDQLMRSLGLQQREREADAADTPIVGRLFRRGGEFSGNSRPLADFWDDYLTYGSRLQAWRKAQQEGRQPAAPMSNAELYYAQQLEQFHKLIKVQSDIAAKTSDARARQSLYQSASRTAEHAVKLRPK